MFQNPELKIDNEFEKLLFTNEDCTPLFVPIFYKKLTRDRQGHRIPCPACNTNPSGNVEGSQDCAYCEGVGYKWSEGISEGWFYKQSYMTDRSIVASVPLEIASASFDKIYLAFKKELRLKEGDIVLRPEVGFNKKIVTPIVNNGMYKVYDSLNLSSNQTFSEYNIVSLTTTFGDYFRGLLK